MKKITALFLSILLFLNGFSFCAVAAQEEAAPTIESKKYDAKLVDSIDYLSERVDMTEFRNYLIGEISNCNTKIDISRFQFDSSEETGTHLYNYIYQAFPELFHIASLSLYQYYVGSTFNWLSVKYDYIDSNQYKAMMKECNAVADRILEGVRGNDALSDVEKALIVHDRLALHLTYDYDHIYSNRDFYEAFVKGTAVCRGYTEAYAYLLNELGIPNEECSSKSLNHSWNIVYVDGESYHVDITWDDDDRSDRERVSHNNFLRSTQGMIESGHGNRGDTVETIDYDNTPTSTKYDSAKWQESLTAFQLVGDDLYYLNAVESTLCKWDASEPVVLHKYDSLVFGGGFASACNSLLFSKHDGVYAYHLSDGSVYPIYQPTFSEVQWIIGFTYKDKTLNCKTDSSEEVLSIPYEILESDHLFDFEGDGRCTLCGAAHERHLYDHACDTSCNLCSAEREAPGHTYDNACDADCNECGEIRTTEHDFSANGQDTLNHFVKCSVCGAADDNTRAPHVYGNACDATCDDCGFIRTPASHVYTDARDTDCNECGFVRELPFTLGDLDGVEGVTSADAIYLLYHTLLGNDRYPVSQPVDYNKDGAVSSADAIYLLYHSLLGADRYPL